MTAAPQWFAAVVAVMVLVGAAFALIGSLGIVRLGSFYNRVHASTLGTTLATTLISFAALVHSLALANGPALYVLLIVATITLSTPASLILLVRAAVFRDRHERSVPQRPDDANRS